eukprot:gene362-684_t
MKCGGVDVKSEPTFAHPMFPELLKKVRKPFNVLIANWYSNGRDCFAEHSDDENLDNVPIFFLMLGAPRTLRVRTKTCRTIVLELNLEHGDLFIMGGKFQDQFLYEITKKCVFVGDDCRSLSVAIRAIEKCAQDDADDVDWERFINYDVCAAEGS